MSTDYSMRAPGGWAKTLKLLVGGVGGTALGALLIYGSLNGGQVEHYCEGVVLTATGAGYNAFSCLNPLPDNETGAIFATGDTGIFVDNAPAPASKLYVGTATTPSGSGLTLFNNLPLATADRFYSTSTTGSAVRTSGIIYVAPKNSGGKRYIVGRYGTGSGQVASGLKVGMYRFRVFPCSQIAGLSCR